jgi:mannan endo-1,4-beta-mannosidase
VGGDGSGGSSGGGSGTSGCSDGSTAPGFYIEEGTLYDNHCNAFVMRGVNHPHAWYDGYAGHFEDIANAGANAVRVVMATGDRWAITSPDVVSAIISAAKANNLVAVLEVHDSTGYAEQADSVHPQNAVDYWKSIASVLNGEEAFVIINIANEPFGNTDSGMWQSFHEGAVQELRSAGLSHTLMVDAPNWGQDWENTMRDGNGAQAIMDADPDKNVVFSVHMYDVYSSSNAVSTYLSNFTEKGLPLVVGEFAADHGTSGDVDEGAILEFSSALGVGYLGWSWSGNGGELGTLDITNNFNADNLTAWGDALINGPYGIKATSELCTCFDF